MSSMNSRVGGARMLTNPGGGLNDCFSDQRVGPPRSLLDFFTPTSWNRFYAFTGIFVYREIYSTKFIKSFNSRVTVAMAP